MRWTDVEATEGLPLFLPRFDRRTWYVLGLSAALFVLLSGYATLLYHSFWSTGSDLGSYVHMFRTTLSGEGFLHTGKFLPYNPTGSYWGAHFSLTLLAFLPLYALWPSPVALLVGKSLALAASVPLLWVVARRETGDDGVAGLLVASYAVNPFLWTAWLFDFQEQSLLPVLVLAAYHAYRRRWHGRFLGLVGLALLTNEFVAPIVVGALAGLGVAAYRAGDLDARRRVLATGLGLSALVHVVAGLVTGRFNRYVGIPTAQLAPPLVPFVQGERATIGRLVELSLANPGLLPAVAVDAITWKVVFLVLFLVPTAFLALTDEVSVGALVPYLAFAWLFTAAPVYYVFGAHYALYLLPFLYVGTARVVGRVTLPRPSRALLARLFVVVVLLSVAGAVSFGVEHRAVPRVDEHTRTLESAIDAVPRDASLVTQNTVYPHVADRPHSRYVVDADRFRRYVAQNGPVTPEYVLLDTNLDSRQFDWSGPLACAFGDRLGTEYGLARYEDGVWVFQRGYDGPTRAVTSDRVVGPGPTGERAGQPAPAPGFSEADCAPSRDVPGEVL